MSHLNGLLCRGVLLGYAKVPDNYRDRTSKEMVYRDAHLIGIERDAKGRFGESRKVTVQLRIPDDLLNLQNNPKGMAFFKEIENYKGTEIEVSLSGYSDFQNRLYISNDASFVPVN